MTVVSERRSLLMLCYAPLRISRLRNEVTAERKNGVLCLMAKRSVSCLMDPKWSVSKLSIGIPSARTKLDASSDHETIPLNRRLLSCHSRTL